MNSRIEALVRKPSPSIVNCELSFLERRPIDFHLLVKQHEYYCHTLSTLGIQVSFLEALNFAPDGVFVEDGAIVLNEIAVICRPGTPSRLIEVPSIANILLSKRKVIGTIASPGTLDGGDVLMIGRRLYVGRSARTNDSGITQLQNLVLPCDYQVIAVDIQDCLHLKSGITFLGNGFVLANPKWIDMEKFKEFEVININPEEHFAANALLIDDKLIYGQEYPKTTKLIENAGFKLIQVPNFEFAKAEGGLTCRSLIFESHL